MIPLRIIVHCSATQDSGTVSWGAIRKYHKEILGWKDIGYHFGIEYVGDQLEILLGRMPNEVGSHVKDHNVGSIGICVIGNFDVDIVAPEHEQVIWRLIWWLREIHKIPLSEIYGHRDFDSGKSCPGGNLYGFLQSLKKGWVST